MKIVLLKKGEALRVGDTTIRIAHKESKSNVRLAIDAPKSAVIAWEGNDADARQAARSRHQ